MKIVARALLIAFLGSGFVAAETIVEIGDRPIVDELVAGRGVSEGSVGLTSTSKSNNPQVGLWFIPYFSVDRIVDGDSTYLSIRNESGLTASVLVEYYDVYFLLQTSVTYEIASRELKPIGLRFVPHLDADPDGYARGFIRVTAQVPVTIDYHHLETRNNFAVGGVGYVEDDMCSRWNARFLKFDPSGGTTLSMMINGPRGANLSDPVTIAGDVYSESGDFISSFTIRTDQWALEIPFHSLVPDGVTFGVAELLINAINLPSGIVELRHEALERFSVGHRAMCVD